MQTNEEGGYIDFSSQPDNDSNRIRINDSKLCLKIQHSLDQLNNMFTEFPKAFNAITDDYEQILTP